MNTNWLSLSFIVLAILALQDIIHRFFMKKGFTSIEIVLYGFIPTIITAICYIYWNSIKMTRPDRNMAVLFIFSGILSFITFLLLREAQIRSPNIGYVTAITYSSVAFTIILTSIIFKDTLDWKAVLGALLIITGIGLITSVKQK